jgi:DNA replication protein DnaC
MPLLSVNAQLGTTTMIITHNASINGRQGRLAEHLTRMDFIVLDELGYLPLAQSGGQLLFHLVSRLYGSFASLARLSNIAARFLRAE